MIIQDFLLCCFYYIYFVAILAIFSYFKVSRAGRTFLKVPGAMHHSPVSSLGPLAVCDTRVPVMRLALDWRKVLEEHPV